MNDQTDCPACSASLPIRKVHRLPAPHNGSRVMLRLSPAMYAAVMALAERTSPVNNTAATITMVTDEWERKQRRLKKQFDDANFDMMRKQSSFERANSNQPFYQKLKGKKRW